MKFLDYLNESTPNVAKMFNPTDKDTAIELLKTKCKKSVKNGVELYRGMKSGTDFVIGHGELGDRKSIKISNHYTKIIDYQLATENPQYPLRSKSIICTNYDDHAKNFGTLYVVIPFDNVTVGITSSYDIWYTTIDIGNLKQYQLYKLNTIWDSIGVDDSFKSLESFAKMVENEYIAMTKGYVSENRQFINMFDGIKDIQSEIIRAYSIKSLKLKFKQSHLFKAKQKHEVWFSGECVMIKKSVYDEIKDQL